MMKEKYFDLEYIKELEVKLEKELLTKDDNEWDEFLQRFEVIRNHRRVLEIIDKEV